MTLVEEPRRQLRRLKTTGTQPPPIPPESRSTAIARTAHRLRWSLLLVAIAVVVLVAYTGYQAVKAKEALDRVAADFQTLRSQLATGDTTGAASTVHAAQDDSQAALHNTRGPGWWLTGMLPEVGANVQAVRTVADVANRLSTNALPDVVRAAETLQPDKLRPHHGRIDLAPIRAIAPTVVRADKRLKAQTARVEAIDSRDLAAQIAAPVRTLQTKLADASDLSDRASRAVQLLPPMLGGNGRRTYLFLFQNNAEVRATGGIPGSFAAVTADHGRLTMGRQGDAATIGRFDHPVLPLTPAEKQLFGANLAKYPQDVNFTPDFPRSAQLIAAMWNARYNEKVSAVVSVDPVALSYLLKGTGPVQVAGGQQLTSFNAVQLLLNQVYFRIADPAQQNVFFNSVARRVFGAVISGRGQPRSVLQGLTEAADEHRVLVWSSRPAEQALLAPTAMSGQLRSQPSTSPNVGVYLDDASIGKMDYYLHYHVDVASTGCRTGRQQLEVTLSMRSAAPANVSRFPAYVLGPKGLRRAGTFLTTMYFYLPVGGHLNELRIDGTKHPFSLAHHDGRTVVAQTVALAPGQRHTLRLSMVGGAGQQGTPVLRVTPGAHGSGIGTVTPSSCANAPTANAG